MASRIVRKNEGQLRLLRAAAFALFTGWALYEMQFAPIGAAFALAIAVGAISLFSPGLGVIVSVISLSLPILAADLVAGAVFLVVGLAAVTYLGQDNARSFLVIALAFVGAAFGPLWAAAVIAGYIMGASEGAVAAILACLALEAAGIALGTPTYGLVVSGGGGNALISFENAPENLITFGWVSEGVDTVAPQNAIDSLSGIQQIVMLIVQPILWGVAAAVAGSIRRPLNDKRRAPYGLLAAAAGVLTLALTSTIALALLSDVAIDYTEIGTAAISSLLVAVGFIAIWEWVFPPIARRVTAPSTTRGSMQAEDADVDELLRLIATAEDELASKHTVEAVVMITDMKSFSAMTEEEGSFTSAKTIQRHRDLLVPVIEEYGGHGKSTGGDGLVASFDSASRAIHAATEMQNTLTVHNATHTSERDIVIRVGIASGEVVLDRSGRPFIGNALNLAARVMNLGDGGQILTTEALVDEAQDPSLTTHRHGAYELKNIAEPVPIVEIMWAEGQEPLEPGTS
jgi:class 3 adenylate cyclase